jgi:hypothetical protein
MKLFVMSAGFSGILKDKPIPPEIRLIRCIINRQGCVHYYQKMINLILFNTKHKISKL